MSSVVQKVETKVVILSESAVASFAKDIVTFIMFAGLMYFNHAVLAGSTIVDVIFIIIVFLWLLGKKSSRVFEGSREDAVDWLEESLDEDECGE